MNLKRTYLLPLITIFLLSTLKSFSQVNTYGFSQSTGNAYTRLTNPSILSPVSIDTFVKLPFSFYLDTAKTDTLFISQHGYVSFKKTGLTYSGSGPLTNNANYKWVIAPFGIQLTRLSGGSPSTIRTDTTGSAPNRIYKIEWSNFKVNSVSGLHYMSFQLWIYESSKKIEFHYGTFTTPSSYSSAQVGLRAITADFAAGQITSRRTATGSWTATVASTSLNEVVCSYSSTNKPDSGLVFIWTPAPSCSTISSIGNLPDSVLTCFNTPATLARTTAPVVSGLWYQWQIQNGSNWNDVTNGTGYNNASYTTTDITIPVYYRLKATCATNSQVMYTNATKARANDALNTPYHEDFSGISYYNPLPECMYSSNLNRVSGGSGGMHNSACIEFEATGTQPSEALITPGIYLSQGTTYVFSFWYRGDDQDMDDTLQAMIGNFPTKGSLSAINAQSIIQPASDNFRYAYFEFTVPASGTYYLGIMGWKPTSGSMYVDDVDVREKPMVDVTVDSVFAPSVWVPQCYTSATDIKLRITNLGSQSVSNIPAYYKVGNTTYGPETISSTIAPGGSIVYTFSQKADLSGNHDYYYINGWTGLGADSHKGNDTTTSFTFWTDSTAALPYLEDFDNGLGLYDILWREHPVLYRVYSQFYLPSSSRNLDSRVIGFSLGQMDPGLHPLWTPLVGPATAKTFLQFDYRIVNYAGTSKFALNIGDTIFVVVSADCGVSYDTLYTIHAGNQPSTNEFTTTLPKSLASYTGNKLRFAFWMKVTGTSQYAFLDIDNFHVFEIEPHDIAITELPDIKAIACPGSSIPVKVALKNVGGLPASGFNIKGDYGTQTGAINYSYTGTLQYMEADTVIIGSFSPSSTGTFHYKIYIILTADTSYANDTMKGEINVLPVPAAPVLNGTTICSGDTAHLNGIENDSLTIFWYDNTASTTPVHRGTPFVTPILAANTTYYGERVSKLLTKIGKTDYTSGGTFFGTQWGLILDASSDCRLDSFAVYPQGTGYFILKIVSCVGCGSPVTIDSIRYDFNNASGSKTMLKAGTFIPEGKGYFMRIDAYNNLTLKRDFPFTGYPLRSNSPLSIRSGYGNNQSQYDGYYYFYDMAITAFGCGSASKTPVTVTVDPLPQTSFTYSQNIADFNFTNTSQFGGTYVWHFGDGNTSTMTSPTHTYAQNGNYPVKLVQTNNCGKDSIRKYVYVTGLSVEGIEAGGEGISIFPNPADDILNINYNSKDAGELHLNIYGVNGQLLIKQNLNSNVGANNIIVHTSDLPAGQYYLQITGASKSETIRFNIVRN